MDFVEDFISRFEKAKALAGGTLPGVPDRAHPRSHSPRRPASTKTHSAAHRNAGSARRRSASSASHHSRKCAVCAHTERAAIEFSYLRWCSPAQIAAEFKLYDRQTVYRHARATGLDHRRGRSLAAALEHIIERVSDVPVTAAAIVQAVKAYAILNGEWHEPPRQVIVYHADGLPPDGYNVAAHSRASARPAGPVSSAGSAAEPQSAPGSAPASAKQADSNSHTAGLENDATH